MKGLTWQSKDCLLKLGEELEQLQVMRDCIEIDIDTEHWKDYEYVGDINFYYTRSMPEEVKSLFNLEIFDDEALFKAYGRYVEVYLAPTKKHYVFLIADSDGNYKHQARATQGAYFQIMQEMELI